MNNKIKYSILSLIVVIIGLFGFYLLNNKEKKIDYKPEISIKDNNIENNNTSISEFPDAIPKFKKMLTIQENNLKNCNPEIDNCNFYTEFIIILNSYINFFENKEKECFYIEKMYGKEAYNRLEDNMSLFAFKEDEETTKELFKKTKGKILSSDNGFTEKQVYDIYYNYIKNEEFPKLEKLRKEANDLKLKALYSYDIAFLFIDIRLFNTLQ